MQRSLNGANNFSSLIGNALNKYANLADIGDAPTARTNLGLVGQLTVSPDYLYQNPGTFDGTTNSQIGVNASTNATASTLVAYDASGTISANSYQIIDYQNNPFTSIQFANLIPLSQNILNTWSISAPSYANVSGNIYHFERKITGNNNYFGVLNVDYIYLTSAASSLTISAPVNVGAITTSGNIKFNTANSSIIDANSLSAITFDGIGNTTINGLVTLIRSIQFNRPNLGIYDVNNQYAIQFDGSANVRFYNNISVPNQATIGGIVIPSPATTLNFYSNSTTLTGARTDTSGNIFATNLYRTIWNQALNKDLTTTSLGSTFLLPRSTMNYSMTTTVSYRVIVPFTYYGETYITLNVYLKIQILSTTTNFRLEIYSSDPRGDTLLYSWVTTYPSSDQYLKVKKPISSPTLTVGNCYYVALSDYTSSSSTSFGYCGGEISLGNN